MAVERNLFDKGYKVWPEKGPCCSMLSWVQKRKGEKKVECISMEYDRDLGY